MLQISLREFANRSEAEILQWLDDAFYVEVTDDLKQTMVTNNYDLMVSWYGLEFHRRYPKYPYEIKEIVKTKTYEDEDLQRPIGHFLNILEEDVDDPVEVDMLKRIVYAWQIKLNNFFSVAGRAGLACATAEDICLIMDADSIQLIKERLRSGKINFDEAEQEFKEAILHDPALDDRTFAIMARTGDVSVSQGFQLFIALGARFDLGNQILPNEIMQSFGEGIDNLADLISENRSAGKALISNGRALEAAEWFHRKLHLLANVVMDVHHMEDCGTTTTVPMEIASKALLKSLRGKYYFDEESNDFLLLTKERMKRFKVGDTINFRSIAFCKSKTSGQPCGKCYGKMKAMIPYNVIMWKSANPGLFSATAIAERIGQALLSTKHFLRHTTTQPFVVGIGDEPYIDTDGDNIFLNERLCREGTYLVLPVQMVSELSDLISIENLDEINEDQLTNFSKATFLHSIEDPMVPGTFSEQIIHVCTTVSSRLARMSKEFIEYVVEHGWTKDKKTVKIDISKYSPKDPLFFLPYIHEDLNQYRIEIEQFVNLSNRNNVWIQREVTPAIFGETLSEFWRLVNRKFAGFNIIHSETLLYAICGKDPANGFYGLPVGDEPRYFIPFEHAIKNRGAGTMFIYQTQIKVLENPDTYDVKERQPTLFDSYFANTVL